MFGRNDWNKDGSYDYSDQAMDMMSMRYVMTDGTWEDEDEKPSRKAGRDDSYDWDDDYDRDDDDEFDEDYDDEEEW